MNIPNAQPSLPRAIFIDSHTTVKTMKRPIALLFCVLMITIPLLGYLSSEIGSDGKDGADGQNGMNGADGQNGMNGIDGQNGLEALLATSDEPEGLNCQNGGIQINAGVDDNNDGVLDNDEIDSTEYVCDGGSSVNNMLTSIIPTDEALDCTAGSKTIAHGLDNGDDSGTPANGILDSGEVDTTITTCSRYSPGIFKILSQEGNDWTEELIEYNNELYFAADDGIHGRELWKTDGTPSGTIMVADIAYNGTGVSSHPYSFIKYNNELYFTATDGSYGIHGRELWKTDGTESGTRIVTDLTQDTSSGVSGYSNLLTVADGKLFFVGQTGWQSSTKSLYVSDGTENGTFPLTDTCPGCNDNIVSLHEFNGEIYFSAAYQTMFNNELWKSDGTSEGTILVKEINSGSSSSLCTSTYNSCNFVEFDNSLYFLAESPELGLWKTDGTNFNTVEVDLVHSQVGVGPVNSSTLTYLHATESKLYFGALENLSGLDPNTNRSLWSYDPLIDEANLIWEPSNLWDDSLVPLFSDGEGLYLKQTYWTNNYGLQNHLMFYDGVSGLGGVTSPFLVGYDLDLSDYLIDGEIVYLRQDCSSGRIICIENPGGWMMYNMSTGSLTIMYDANPNPDYIVSELTKMNEQIFFVHRSNIGTYNLGSFDGHVSTEIIVT